MNITPHRDSLASYCCKCGGVNAKIVYIATREDGYISGYDRDQERAEHLRYTCQACNYVWTMQCLDATPAITEAGDATSRLGG